MLTLENERFIRLLLLEKGDHKDVGHEVSKYLLLHSSQRSEDLITLLFCLIGLRHFHAAIDYLETHDWNSSNAPIPMLMALSAKLGVELPFEEEVASQMSLYSRSQSLFFANPKLLKSSKIKELYKRNLQVLKKINDERFDKLVDQLEFFKSQRMWRDQREILQKLETEFPNNKKTAEFQKSFEEVWAMEKIEQAMVERANAETVNYKPALTSSEIEMLDVIYASATELLTSERYLPSDFAMMFHFFDAPHLAIDFLRTSEKSIAQLWLEAELLFICGRFVDVLLVLRTIGEVQQNFPETQFSISYLRAQCFWKLGQKQRAKELVSDILRVRPDYRSAKSLQINWNGIDRD